MRAMIEALGMLAAGQQQAMAPAPKPGAAPAA
jgi:hypothetical protein